MSSSGPIRVTGATDAWLTELRSRFLAVARRRVTGDAAEDVVQEALRILVEKSALEPGAEGPGGAAVLAYGFAVLRNVIGNYYQRERVRRTVHEPESAAGTASDPAPTPLEALAAEERIRMVRESLETLAASDRACARYLKRLLDGATPRDLASQEGLEEAVLYRRVYRCRLKLRALLEQRGVGV
jgi:RNA polymerase sigma factor (sigma-70 family)